MSKLVHDPELKDMLQGPLLLLFNIIDANSDQLISRDELIQYFEVGIYAYSFIRSYMYIRGYNNEKGELKAC